MKIKPAHTIYAQVDTIELFPGLTMKVLLGSKETNGLQAMFEDIVDPGVGLARHIHHQQDETFIFLEGAFDVEVDGKLYRMTAGDVAFIPKGSVHTWKNVGTSQGRIRYIFSPALNIEEMFRELNELRQSGEFTEELAQELATKYPEQETVGPPLE